MDGLYRLEPWALRHRREASPTPANAYTEEGRPGPRLGRRRGGLAAGALAGGREACLESRAERLNGGQTGGREW